MKKISNNYNSMIYSDSELDVSYYVEGNRVYLESVTMLLGESNIEALSSLSGRDLANIEEMCMEHYRDRDFSDENYDMLKQEGLL